MIQSVGDWLADLELSEYENTLVGNGYDDMDFMVRTTHCVFRLITALHSRHAVFFELLNCTVICTFTQWVESINSVYHKSLSPISVKVLLCCFDFSGICRAVDY